MTKPKPRARGSVRTHKGSLELRAYAGINPATGRRHYLYDHCPASTPEAEVERRLTALVHQADQIAAVRDLRRRGGGGHVEQAEIDRTRARHGGGQRTVLAALEAWYRAVGQHLAGAQTVRQHIDVYLVALHPVALWRLRPAVDPDDAALDPDLVDLSAFYDQLLAEGSVGKPGKDGRRTGAGAPMKPSSVHRIHATLHAALAHAATRGWLPAGNPASGIRFPADEAAAVVPEAEEMEPLIGWLAAANLEAALVAVLVGNGLRPQEVAALAWNELDMDTGRLSLTGRGIVRVSMKPERWELRTAPTDKRRKRTIMLPPPVMELARRHRLHGEEIALACGERIGRRGYVFTESPDGSTFLTPHSLGTAFTRGCERARQAGLELPEGMTLYSCRHYGITHALRGRTGVAEVARRFGTSQRMIHQRYNHAIPGEDEQAAAVMAEVWALPAPAVDAEVVPLR